MRPSYLHFARLLFYVIPETRLFGFKAKILRLTGANVGRNVRICSSVTIIGSGHLEVGEDTWIGHKVLICAGSQVTIGRAVDIGPRVYIGTGTHEISLNQAHSAGAGINKDIVVGDGVWIGVGSIVLPGVSIGDKAIIAAGAVVTENVPPRVLVGGVPARMIRDLREAAIIKVGV